MKDLTPKGRLALAAAYVALMVESVGAMWVLTLVFNAMLPKTLGRVVGLAVVFAHSVPLLIVRFAWDLLFDGPGGDRPAMLILQLCAWAAVWWPLPVFAAFPRLWTSQGWRKTALVYFVALAGLTVAGDAYILLNPSVIVD